MAKDLVVSKKSSTFALAYQKWQQITLQGVLTERLGNGLQNRVERFDSARHLFRKKEIHSFEFPFFRLYPTRLWTNKSSLLHSPWKSVWHKMTQQGV